MCFGFRWILALLVFTNTFPKSFKGSNIKIVVFSYRHVSVSPWCSVAQCLPQGREHVQKEYIYFNQMANDESVHMVIMPSTSLLLDQSFPVEKVMSLFFLNSDYLWKTVTIASLGKMDDVLWQYKS